MHLGDTLGHDGPRLLWLNAPGFARLLMSAQPLQPGCCCLLKAQQLGLSCSGKNQHIGNLSFRPDKTPSFHMQTALKII